MICTQYTLIASTFGGELFREGHGRPYNLYEQKYGKFHYLTFMFITEGHSDPPQPKIRA